MTSPSPVPRRVRTPRWFDVRLVLGVLLVAASVAVGARLVSSAGSTTGMLVAAHDLEAGTVLQAADLHTRQMRLSDSSGAYFTTGAQNSLSGRTLTAPVHAGDLVARSAVGSTQHAASVTVPVSPEAVPDVQRGQRVTIYVGTNFCQGVVVLSNVTVQDVRKPGTGALSAASDEALVVRIPTDDAGRVVAALDLPDATIRVVVLSGPNDDNAKVQPGDLSRCRQSGAADSTSTPAR